MDNKIRYIQSITGSVKDTPFELEADEKDQYFAKLKNLIGSKYNLEPTKLKVKPTPRCGQLWLTKHFYEDYFTNLVQSSIPFIVLIVGANESLENELFSRVQPISQFVEFERGDDYIIADPSIIGFSFLIETWNEQPLLNDILDYYLGSIDVNQFVSFKENVDLSEQVRSFRKLEIDNTVYLRNSIISYLSFLEERQTEDTGVIININNTIVKPAFYADEIKYEDYYAQAAKTGLDNSNKYFELEDIIDSNKIKIRIKRNIEDFVVSIYSDIELVLKNIDNKVLRGEREDNRIIYSRLNPGLYYLESTIAKSLIKIRIK
jgi:hypothetical protein